MKGTTQAYYYANTCRKEAISSSRDILVTDRSTKELNERTNVRMSRRTNERMSVRVNEPTDETTNEPRNETTDESLFSKNVFNMLPLCFFTAYRFT